MFTQVLSRWLLLLSCAVLVLPATTIYNLNDAFGASNPSGAWTFREGSNVLPVVSSWIPGNFAAAQSAYAKGTVQVPSWLEVSANPLFASTDFQLGDVLVHSSATGVANVMWTSPLNGVADVTGGLWMARNIGRGNHFELFLNSTLLAQGNVSDGDIFSRSNPLGFSLGNLALRVGDVVRLEVTKTSTFGDFSGVNLSIGVNEIPEPSLSILVFSGLATFSAILRFRRRRAH